MGIEFARRTSNILLVAKIAQFYCKRRNVQVYVRTAIKYVTLYVSSEQWASFAGVVL